jgi:ketosteroid isomerase-like protein
MEILAPVAQTNSDIAAEIYAVFDYRSAAAGLLDPLWERYATADLELEPPPIYPDMGVYRGLEEVRAFFRMLTEVWEEWDMEPGEMEAAGDHVLVPVQLHTRGRGSGLELPAQGFHLWTFRDGKAAKIKTFFDEAEARRAAGLSDLQSRG